MSSSLLNDLYAVSENRDLFERLQDGVTAGEIAASPVATTVLQKARNAILTCLKTESTVKLENLMRGSSEDAENGKILLLGECILAWTAAQPKKYKELLRTVITENLRRQATGIYLRAWREWLSIWIEQLEGTIKPAEVLNLRYILAGCTDQLRPGLVGESYYKLGKMAVAAGKLKNAKRCFNCVRMDLGDNLTSPLPNHLRFEVGAILHWYRLSCEELIQLQPEQEASTRADLETVVKQDLAKSAPTVVPNGPMWGPIAKTYLSREHYIGDMLEEIQATSSDNTTLARICYKYDFCHEIDDYLFAIERFTLPAKTRSNYEPTVQEAIDVLQRKKNGKSGRLPKNQQPKQAAPAPAPPQVPDPGQGNDEDDDLLTQFRKAVSDPSFEVATASYFLERCNRDVQAAAALYFEESQDL